MPVTKKKEKSRKTARKEQLEAIVVKLDAALTDYKPSVPEKKFTALLNKTGRNLLKEIKAAAKKQKQKEAAAKKKTSKKK